MMYAKSISKYQMAIINKVLFDNSLRNSLTYTYLIFLPINNVDSKNIRH